MRSANPELSQTGEFLGVSEEVRQEGQAGRSESTKVNAVYTEFWKRGTRNYGSLK
jgi:hypothetical protein